MLLLLVTSHRLCTESVQPQGWGLSGLLCLSASWPACRFVLLRLAVTTALLTDQQATASLFCVFLSFHGTTVFLSLMSWCSTEKCKSGVATDLRKWGHGVWFRKAQVWDGKRWGTDCHWKPQVYKQSNNSQLKKCRWTNVLELDKTSYSGQQREQGTRIYCKMHHTQ